MLTKSQDRMLNQISDLVQKFRKEAHKIAANSSRVRPKRRTSAEVQKMRKEIVAARGKGVAASVLAEKYGVSSAYIYMIKE